MGRHSVKEFALLSKAAYAVGNRSKVVQVLKKAGLDVGEYDILKETDNDDLVVRMKDTGDIIVAVRGTDISNVTGNRLSDLSHWPSVALGADKVDTLVARVKRDVAQLHGEYSRSKIYLTGHSLGGWVASVIAKGSGVKAVVFNPATGIDALGGHIGDRDENVVVYTTNDFLKGKFDPASVLTMFGKSKVVHVPVTTDSVHTIDNFTDFDDDSGLFESIVGPDIPSRQEVPRSRKRKSVSYDPGPVAGRYMSTKFRRYSEFRAAVPKDIQERAWGMHNIYTSQGSNFVKGREHQSEHLYGFDRNNDDEIPNIFKYNRESRWYYLEKPSEGHVRIYIHGGMTDATTMISNHERVTFPEELQTYSRFLRNGVQENVEFIGHSLGGYKARYFIEELAREFPDVRFKAVILNGHLTTATPFTRLPSNASVEYHTIFEDVTDMKDLAFRRAETGNGATFYHYLQSPVDHYADPLRRGIGARKSVANMTQRFNRTHQVTQFMDMELDNPQVSESIINGPRGGAPYDRMRRNNFPRDVQTRLKSKPVSSTVYNVMESAGGAIATVGGAVGGELIAGAFDPLFSDDDTGAKMGHAVISNVSGASLTGVGSAGFRAAQMLAGGSRSFSTIARSSLQAGASTAAPFSVGAIAGAASQYGTEELMNYLLTNAGVGKDETHLAAGLTSKGVGLGVAVATQLGLEALMETGAAAGAAGGPVVMAIGAGLGLFLGVLGDVQEYVKNKRDEEWERETETYKKQHLGLSPTRVGNTDLKRRAERKQQAVDILPELQKWTSQKGEFSKIAHDLFNQVNATEPGDLATLEYFPSVDEMHSLFVLGTTMSAFLGSKQSFTFTPEEEKGTSPPRRRLDTLLSEAKENGHYGFSALRYVVSAMYGKMQNRGWVDQFVSGVWNDHDFKKLSDNIETSASQSRLSRNEGEMFSSYAARVKQHVARVKQEEEVAPLRVGQNQYLHDTLLADKLAAEQSHATFLHNWQQDHDNVYFPVQGAPPPTAQVVPTRDKITEYQSNVQTDMQSIYGIHQISAMM
jgi:predicted esterase YcpF (UPF0227 family)